MRAVAHWLQVKYWQAYSELGSNTLSEPGGIPGTLEAILEKDGKPFTWLQLEKLLEQARQRGEKFCLQLMRKEITSTNRPQFVLRIYGRFSRLRAARERKEIFEGKVPR